ncbi:A-kinase anchor protein 14 isoform X2 [Sylvia atricapilla]|uniref:A-kinase anchor protein 14 isoform X2 n=1 Tax=Sylvia atricapilla TaxID=48155 RepID=UPI003399D2AF
MDTEEEKAAGEEKDRECFPEAKEKEKEFLDEEELKDSKWYHYKACWGLPTRRKPVPRATASVYFVIVISKLKPDTLPVQVFYRLESSRLIRRPEQCQFREKWLQDIIENKIVCAERVASR